MIKRLLLLLIIFALTHGVKAQIIPTLKVTSITENGPAALLDTIYGNQLYSYNVIVTNTDSTLTYTNDTSFIFSIKFLSDTSFGPFSILDDSTPFIILPGDSITFQTTDSFPSGAFKLGNNVVVVWPSKAGGFIVFNSDSDTISIFYAGTSGISYYDKNDFFIYPNPFNDFLNFNNTFNSGVQLFIYDEAGRLLYQNPFDKKSYDLSFLKEGMYFVELRKTNAVLARRKLLKM